VNKTCLALLAITVLCRHDIVAQNTASQPVRLATAGFIDSLIQHLDGYRDRQPRLLVPAALPVMVSGSVVEKARSVAPRTTSESAALAMRLGAVVAASDDTIFMANGQPRGTMGVQIRIGDPQIVGDSAVLLFALQSRGTTGRMLPGFANRYVVVLRRHGTDWSVQAFGKANQDKVPAVLTAVSPSRR